jgi:hypothetical protein
MRKMLTIAVIVFIAALLLIPRLYMYSEFGGPDQVLWNDKECFIFVQTNHSGWRLTPLQYVKSPVLEWLGGRTDFTDTDATVQVFHIHDGRVDGHTVRHFQLATTIFPHEGKLCIMMYYTSNAAGTVVISEPKSYVWNGETFVLLGKDEADRIRVSFQYQEDILHKEGWSSKTFNSSFSDWKVEIMQPNGSYLVEMQHPSELSTAIRLRGPGVEQTLATYGDGRPRLVSKGKYYLAFSPKS